MIAANKVHKQIALTTTLETLESFRLANKLDFSIQVNVTAVIRVILKADEHSVEESFDLAIVDTPCIASKCYNLVEKLRKKLQ